MDQEEIDSIPEFKADIDEALLSKLAEGDPLRSILQNTNVTRQYVRWAAETARRAFNLSIQNERRLNKAQTWISIVVGAALLAGVVKILFTK